MENFLRSLDRRHFDNYFDVRQGKAENIQDYIFREEILTVALQKDTAIDLDEKIRGYSPMRTTQLAQVKKAITQTIGAKKREEVRDTTAISSGTRTTGETRYTKTRTSI